MPSHEHIHVIPYPTAPFCPEYELTTSHALRGRAYLAVIASNGGLEANLLVASVPVTLQYFIESIESAIEQVPAHSLIYLHYTDPGSI
jgi:hypothetical protein